MSEELDDEYGPAATGGDLDPTHLRALAVRIQQLAGIIDVQRSEGRRRDDKIEAVRSEVSLARVDINKLDSDVANLIQAQMTEEDKRTLRALMQSYDFKDRAWKWAKRTAGYIAATATTFFLLREPLAKFLAWLGKAVS